MNAIAASFTISPAEVQARYHRILPIIERYAPLACKNIRCPQRLDDAWQEVHAVVWSWLYRLAQRGIDGTRFPASLAYQAARYVRSHRKITGSERAKDVLSPLAQNRHGFRVESLPTVTRRGHDDIYSVRGHRRLDAFEERLQDNTETPPDQQAMFRLDFANWRSTQVDRDRKIVDDMSRSEGTSSLARKYGLSPARISQKRREYHRSWRQFCGDEPVEAGRQYAARVA